MAGPPSLETGQAALFKAAEEVEISSFGSPDRIEMRKSSVQAMGKFLRIVIAGGRQGTNAVYCSGDSLWMNAEIKQSY